MQDTMTRQPRISDRWILIGALALGAVAAGLIVAFLASSFGSSSASSGSGALVVLPVVVAGQNIAPGEVITADMLAIKELSPSNIIYGAAEEPSLVIGQTVRFPIVEGEQVLISRLVDRSETQALSLQIPPGLRGFTIPVDVTTTPAGLLVPGDFVDVIVSAEIKLLALPAAVQTLSSESDLKAAVTLLQNLQVLSVQRDYVDNGVPYDPTVRGELGDDDSIHYVTLALLPEDVQILWLASQEGEITLSLRAYGDDEIISLQPVVEPVRIQ